ncbi:hypothetical protein SOVF_163320 [Spinacia oleracea]|nr:hypothetical protein SOVF_163320 [Spinacia oleracea]
MASGFEPVPISSQKHDPAWRHCEMSKEGARTHLKCIYCSKVFKGGGIHRIKEHLACHKGNASTCHRVPSDVREAMHRSLEGAVVKKKRKQKTGDEEVTTAIINLPSNNDDVDGFANECGISSDIHLIANPSTLETNSTMIVVREESEEGTSVRGPGKRKRGRPPKSALLSMVGNGTAVNEMQGSPKKLNSQVHLAIGRFLYDIGVPLDAVNSVYFQPMLDAIALEGTRVVGPSHHDLRGWILKSAVNDVKADMDYCSRAWGRTGCSVLVEECNIGKEKETTVVNFLAYCPEGTMFLKSVDVTSLMDSAEAMYELVREVVEEVDPKNVLQVITPNDEGYAAIGKRLSETYPTLYWAPCAANSLLLMLEDFGKFEWINSVLEQCKSIMRFIYNHSIVLNMMRRYTFGVDLVVPDLSPSVTNFRTVKRMVDLKHNLQALVTSQEWVDSYYSKKEGALAILDLIKLNSYKMAAGDFGRKMAIRARESLLPSVWWSTYGGGCPNLSRLSVRILSQCCSLTHCKKDLIPLEQLHSTVNCLEHQRLNDQVFTQYNLRLRQMAQKGKEHDNMDPLSVDNHASVADWIARKDLCLDDHGSSDWMAIELPSPSKMRLKSSVDEVEELSGGFDDYEIFGGSKDEGDAIANNIEGE